MQNHVTEAVAVLEDCGHQQELIDLLKNQADQDKQTEMAKQIINLNKVTPTGMK